MFLRRIRNIKYIERSKLRIMQPAIQNQSLSTKSIKEGQAEICLKTDYVFYNPVQEFNRDLSIAVLTVFAEEFKAEKIAKATKKCDASDKDPIEIDVSILEALSATGLRSIRYAKEVPNITRIVANDLSDKAVETIQANIIHNNVQNLVEASHNDACMVMYQHKEPSKRFAAIDLDPYGCPAIFLDAAVQSVQDGGLLLVTATDTAILAGNAPETCYAKYGAVSLKTKCCHEMALRILLQCIESHANRYSRYIVPLLSVSVDFYVRVFVKVYSGALQCKKTTSKLSMVYQCTGCDTLTLQPLGGFKPNPTPKNPDQMKATLPAAPPVGDKCEHCNSRHHLGGPIWSAPIHDESFVSRLLSRAPSLPLGTARRLAGVLSVVREELADAPLYCVPDRLFGRVHMEIMPAMVMRSALLNAGHRVSYSHAAKNSLKTTAPARLVWDVVRAWAADHPVSEKKLASDPVARHILSQAPAHAVDLSPRPDANPTSRRDGALRYQVNPAPNWGPGCRANVNVGDGKLSKKQRNQNKNSNKAKRKHSPEADDTRKKATEDNIVDQ